MSGGSLDYAYTTVLDAASAIRNKSDSATHIAFANHLDLVAKALRDVEWVMSCDKAKGEDVASILEVIQKSAVVEAAISRALAAKSELEEAIRIAQQ